MSSFILNHQVCLFPRMDGHFLLDLQPKGSFSKMTPASRLHQKVRCYSLSNYNNIDMYLFIVDCQYSNWTETGTCNQTCGGGFLIKLRYLISSSSGHAGHGHMCGYVQQVWVPCNQHPCPEYGNTLTASLTVTGVILIAISALGLYSYKKGYFTLKVPQNVIPLITRRPST